MQNADNPQDSTGMEKPWLNERLLRELYQAKGLTTREIADRFDCSNGTVSRWLDNHGIETRENWVAGVEAAKEANRKQSVTLRTLGSGYEFWSSKEWTADGSERVNRIIYVHRLLAVAEYGFEAVAGSDVHHENGVPWDNRAENIEVLSKGEHGRLHSNAYHHGDGGEAA